jgi:dihydroflavonol-4-reductase
MRVFITGGTGYIGGALCRRLVADEHEVRALVRPTSDRQSLIDLGIVCFEGDVTERSSMREGMESADWVIHAAAELDFGSPRERMQGANTLGSENVAALALEMGVGRALHISSIASFGGTASDGSPSTEESPPVLPLPNNYCVTKNAGEAAFRTRAEQGLHLNIVYPSLVYGPPSKKGGINSFLRLILTGRLPALVGADRISTWVFLDDLIEGLMRMMIRAEPGEHYLMSGHRASTAKIVRMVCELGNVRRPLFSLPVPVARSLLLALMPVEVISGRRLPFNNQQLRSLARHWSFDDSKARRDLAWHPRDLDEGLPPTVKFLQGTMRRKGRS